MTRLALLTNFIPPYRLPLFKELANRISSLRIFVSTEMEVYRVWKPDTGGLNVVVQRCITQAQNLASSLMDSWKNYLPTFRTTR